LGHELPASAAVKRGCDRDFDPELVGPVRLALADALHLRGMQGVDLAAPLSLPLILDAPGQRQGMSEDALQALAARDLARDVPDHPPQDGAQAPQGFVGSLELFGMGIALVLNEGALAHSGIRLAWAPLMLLREPHQTLSGPVHELGVGREGDGLLLDRG